MHRWRTGRCQFSLIFPTIYYNYHIAPCFSTTSPGRGDITTYTKRIRISQIRGCRTFVRRMYLVGFEFLFYRKRTNIISSLAASLYPNLFHSLVLIDPVILQPQNLSDLNHYITPFIQGALSRRETWSSKQVDFHFYYYPPFKAIRIDKKPLIHSSKFLFSKPGIRPFSRFTSNVVFT